jgi:hypothetical protein
MTTNLRGFDASRCRPKSQELNNREPLTIAIDALEDISLYDGSWIGDKARDALMEITALKKGATE